ncbi:MAG: AAA family ATPase [Acidimicrobiales bacterium]
MVLVGDHHQLPAIDAGGAFRGLRARLGSLRLSENHRQSRPGQAWERAALNHLRSGEVGAALGAYEGAGRMARFDTAAEAFAALISHWWEIHSRSPETTVAMMAVRNNEVAELNARARSLRTELGELGEELVVAKTGAAFAVGDRVVATENDHRLDILNGLFGTVSAIDSQHCSLTVRTDRGGHLSIPAWHLEAGHLCLGYATTLHKAQGATVDVGLFLATDASYREAGYVALSRGRLANHVFALAPENARWEIGHGADGALIPDAMEALIASLSRSKAQALATEHLADMEVKGVESARRVWEARHRLGQELAASAPPDHHHRADRLEIYISYAEARRTEAAKMVAGAETDLAKAAAAPRRERRDLVPDAEYRLAHVRGRLAGCTAEMGRLASEARELAEAARRREDWVEANADRIAAYREMGVRLAGWERGLGVRASYLRPRHVIDRIGPQPVAYAAGREWEMAAGAIEGYHQRWGIRPEMGLGAEPEDLLQWNDWHRGDRQAQWYVEAGRQRELARERELGLEPELELTR